MTTVFANKKKARVDFARTIDREVFPQAGPKGARLGEVKTRGLLISLLTSWAYGIYFFAIYSDEQNNHIVNKKHKHYAHSIMLNCSRT